jgi:hypothetical protein
MKKFLEFIKNDEGLSLSEVLIAVGLSGLIAIGCTQVALASFNSAKYVESKALNTVNTATLSHTIVSDMENATSFTVHSSTPANACTSKYNVGTISSSVKPLVTVNNLDGSAFGYEVRETNNESALWRVECGPTGSQNGSSMMLRRGLPNIQSLSWNEPVKCVSYPAGGALISSSCANDQVLSSITANPGVLITIPATVSSEGTKYPAQVVLAARNIA